MLLSGVELAHSLIATSLVPLTIHYQPLYQSSLDVAAALYLDPGSLAPHCHGEGHGRVHVTPCDADGDVGS